VRRVLPLFAVLSFAFAPAPFPKPSGRDLGRLQGSWFGDGDLEAKFEQKRLSYYRKGALVAVYRVILLSSARPKAYDLVETWAVAAQNQRYRGIYSLEKRTLKMCSRGWGRSPPHLVHGWQGSVSDDNYSQETMIPLLRPSA
jgi:hypothetical protein